MAENNQNNEENSDKEEYHIHRNRSSTLACISCHTALYRAKYSKATKNVIRIPRRVEASEYSGHE